MPVTGYIAAALVGLSLGLIGGGGSILMVPVLVYLFGLAPVMATSYSLFIVGSTSLVGALNNFRHGYVHVKTAALFGISSVLTVYLTRKIILPAIPENIFTIGTVEVTESLLTMVLFALLMVAAAISMIRNGHKEITGTAKKIKPQITNLLLYGILIGLVTGLLGAGGGFLLIPALVLFVGLPMKKAIGTSLLIIALNSLIGFTGDLGHFEIDWTMLLTITFIAIAGILAGGALSGKIPGNRLKTGFGWFVLVMGIYILAREFFLK